MQITSELIMIMIVLTPGIIGEFTYFKLVQSPDFKIARYSSPFQSTKIIITISILSYSAFGLIAYSLDCDYSIIKIINEEKISNYSKTISEIILVSIISFISSIIFARMQSKGWLVRFLRYIRLTNKSDQDSLWLEVVKRKNETEWIQVRHWKYKMTYFGEIEQFSESDQSESRELIMRKVTVYSFDGVELYEADLLYICGAFDDITIETEIKKSESGSIINT